MANEPRQITLYYAAGNSDKMYALWLERSNGGWKVKYGYGRRGRSLRVDYKTAQTLPYVDAERIYNDMLAAQLKQGYTTEESGKPFAPSKFNGGATSTYAALAVGERATSFGPMLLSRSTTPDPICMTRTWSCRARLTGIAGSSWSATTAKRSSGATGAA